MQEVNVRVVTHDGIARELSVKAEPEGSVMDAYINALRMMGFQSLNDVKSIQLV